MVKCCKENIHNNNSKPQTSIWCTLPETYGVALGTIKEEKKKSYMNFTLLRAKNLGENTDYAILPHMHELFFFFTETITIYRTQQQKKRSRLQYCLFFNCSTAISAWQHVVQENPCQQHLIFGWIGFPCHFCHLHSPPFSREAHIWKWSKVLHWWNCHGSLLILPLSPEHHGRLPATQLDTHPSHNWCGAS